MTSKCKGSLNSFVFSISVLIVCKRSTVLIPFPNPSCSNSWYKYNVIVGRFVVSPWLDLGVVCEFLLPHDADPLRAVGLFLDAPPTWRLSPVVLSFWSSEIETSKEQKIRRKYKKIVWFSIFKVARNYVDWFVCFRKAIYKEFVNLLYVFEIFWNGVFVSFRGSILLAYHVNGGYNTCNFR